MQITGHLIDEYLIMSMISRHVEFSRQNTTILSQNFLILQLFLYTPVFELSVYLLEDAVVQVFYNNIFPGPGYFLRDWLERPQPPC